MEFSHVPVLLWECIEGLNIKPDGVYVDGTLGRGGHSEEIAKRLTTGKLISIDQDQQAIDEAGARLAPYGDKVILVKDNFRNTAAILERLGYEGVDGMLFDLGVSSPQLDDAERGFSYMNDAPLDMRMDRSASITAYDVVNTWSEFERKRILRDYGEERNAGRIASKIVRVREDKPIETTGELNEIIKAAIPAKMRATGGHPSKKTFQAIRIECNRELEVLKNSLDDFIEMLNPGGRLCIITFHSLEDRIVKSAFKKNENPCTCPPEFPVCVCGKVTKGKVVSRKPILPTEEEIENNKRSKSAKLRVFERIGS